MAMADNKNAPWLGGWVIALAMGVAAAAIAIVVGEWRYTIAGFIGIGVCLLAGLVMGMPWGAGSTGPGHKAAPKAMPARVMPASAPAHAPAASFVAPAASPAMAAPVMAAPVMAAPLMGASHGPEQLSGPRSGKADDLKEIEGIGPALEKLCHELGFYHFDQIASWTDADIDWVDQNMKTFKGRILRDKWVPQARIIMAEGLDAFRIRAKTNDY